MRAPSEFNPNPPEHSHPESWSSVSFSSKSKFGPHFLPHRSLDSQSNQAIVSNLDRRKQHATFLLLQERIKKFPWLHNTNSGLNKGGPRSVSAETRHVSCSILRYAHLLFSAECKRETLRMTSGTHHTQILIRPLKRLRYHPEICSSSIV